MAALLFATGTIGGALNAVAGGGSFIVFPTMLFAGVPPVAANATTAAALWPAGLASAVAYRRELPKERKTLVVLAAASALGGTLGAKLLLLTSDETFAKLVPFLLLAASAVFTFGPRLTKRSSEPRPAGEGAAPVSLAAGAFVQLLIASYGGYFGGGMGILMLATLTLMGMANIHEMNALKIVLGILINGAANIAFLLAHKVQFDVAIPVVLGAITGGWLGAATARRFDPKKVRLVVMIFAWSLTAFFFVKLAR
ncbi:MAG: sulfite exporter TauE/SafE family protein [Deltaproteobacteria bacterium]|nr:sulfite exporter TauE/SafE family protein [Deltaproteobacteria bacterium]